MNDEEEIADYFTKLIPQTAHLGSLARRVVEDGYVLVQYKDTSHLYRLRRKVRQWISQSH